MMIPHLPHLSAAWTPFALALWLFAQKAMAFTLSDLHVIMGDTIRDCLRQVRMTEEVAADLMGLDVSHFRKMLRGDEHRQLSLARLLKLGLPFMAVLTPMLMYHSAKLHSQQMLDDAREAAKALGMRKVG